MVRYLRKQSAVFGFTVLSTFQDQYTLNSGTGQAFAGLGIRMEVLAQAALICIQRVVNAENRTPSTRIKKNRFRLSTVNSARQTIGSAFAPSLPCAAIPPSEYNFIKNSRCGKAMQETIHVGLSGMVLSFRNMILKPNFVHLVSPQIVSKVLNFCPDNAIL